MRQRKTILLGLVMALFAAFPLSAVAGDRVTDRPGGDQRHHPADEATDEVVGEADHSDHKVTDRKVTDRKVTDRKVTDRKVTDRKVTDRPASEVRPKDHRPLDRCLHHADNPRRCIDHETDDPVNVRHLLWRLFKAQEWEKLVRLLLRLGLL